MEPFSDNGIKKLRCLTCKYISQNHGKMEEHIKKHQDDFDTFMESIKTEPIKCVELNPVITQKKQDEIYLKAPIKCMKCNYKCNQIKKLKDHMSTHGINRNISICYICQLSFITVIDYDKHVKSHT